MRNTYNTHKPQFQSAQRKYKNRYRTQFFKFSKDGIILYYPGLLLELLLGIILVCG
jgi:hypothetical protein